MSILRARSLSVVTGAIVAVLVVGVVLVKSSIYVPEARAPQDFPKPGKVNQVVIKTYPAYRSASVSKKDDIAAGRDQDRMFGRLFDHIKSNQIAMTAPVEMTFDGDDADSMAFIYGEATIGEAGEADGVTVIDHPPMDVVSIGVRGAYTGDRFEQNVDRLRDWLANQSEWEEVGEPRYMAFNSPFVPRFFRYGEVQIPVARRGDSQ